MMTNGHLPEGAKIATLELLQQANTSYIKAPALSERAGESVYIRIRAIRRAAYLLMLPEPPPGSEEWASDPTLGPSERVAARVAAYTAWLQSLPHDERAQRRGLEDAVTYKLLVAGMVEPIVTIETARDWADDADVIAAEILRFSGLLERVETTTDDGQAAPVAGAVTEVSGAVDPAPLAH